jgi:hypothetical protein
MAEERVDRELGAEEIVARESFNEEGSVEDIFGNCQLYKPPSAGDAKDEASVASRQAPSISAVSNNFGPSSPVRIML